ncbi:TPA: relaxase [Salmonella enterica]|uniref:Relaxase n=1 Tax=Salmonella enterica TaxID=28901 RepID=A0A744CD47_SALER|nr:relaxase [Salmonella enterica]HAF4920017.1 relaxase [Salmonella enterica]
MFRLFRKRAPLTSTSPDIEPRGFIRQESVLVLLGTQRRQMLLEHIWERTSLSRAQFSLLYRQPLERYAALVQNLPASESHHHAYSGGMLDHGLEIVAYALKLRQSRLLPVGTTPEEQAAQSEVWTAAAAYAALLHDLGKIAVDLEVELADGSIWHPWHGPLTQPYRFRYLKERTYRLHSAATALLYTQVLDSRILDWLSKHQEAWSSLLYVLAGQYEHAGVLGELVMQADQASVAKALGGDPGKALAAPKHALQRKLLEGLRYLLKEEFRINQPQASDGWLTQDSLWLVSKTVSDKLRAHLLSQGIDGIPGNNTTLFSILQDHGMVQATEDGKAIWKAKVTGENGWSHTFTFLRLAPALIWDDISLRPPPFAGTVTVEATGAEGEQESSGITDVATPQPTEAANAPVPGTGDAIADLLNMFDTKAAQVEPAAASPDSAVPDTVLPTPSPVPFKGTMAAPAVQMEPTPPKRSEVVMPSSPTAVSETPSGEHFLSWLANAIQTHKLVINDAKALVHTVADTVYLVSPGIFQRYAQEHLQVAVLAKEAQLSDWQWIQKQFEKMQIHRKHANGLNIWTCNVTGPRKSHRLHGYLLNDPSGLFAEQPLNNPYLELVNPVA